MAAPNKAAQDAEALARTQSGIEPGETAQALDVVDADSAPAIEPGATPRPAADPAPAETPPPRSAFDAKRDAIVARFRTDRGLEADGQRDDITEFTRSGMPPEFAEPGVVEPPEPPAPAADIEAEPAAPAGDAPQRFKVKVRGEIRELTQEELIANAQIALGAENYLDEAKGKLKEVDSLLQRTRNQAPHPGQDGVHPAAPNRAQTTEPADDNAGDSQHPENAAHKLIELLQFGDPNDAGKALEDTISERVNIGVEAALVKQRLEDEGARTNKVVKDFEGKYPELAVDMRARAVIETDVVAAQIEDIKALGVDPATIRQDGLPPTPGDIAVAHRWYRAKGYQVRSPEVLLQSATDDFLKWKGDTAKPTQQTPAAPATPTNPRVEVTVDRTVRRAAIPQQPSRTVTPRPASPSPSPAQPRDRSDIISAMRQTRNQPRGRITA